MNPGLEERTNQFNNACQALVGSALFDDHLSPVAVARAFLDRLPEPQGEYEARFYEGQLLRMALMWAAGAHARLHENGMACGFSSADLTERLWSASAESSKLAFARWAEQYFGALERVHLPPAPVRAARRLVDEFAKPLNIQRLSREIGAHVATLRRGFKAYYGVTIRSYHIRVRVLEAIKRLHDRRFDGRSLAAAVGYGSHKNFYRAIRHVTGLSLAELRATAHAEALARAALPQPRQRQRH